MNYISFSTTNHLLNLLFPPTCYRCGEPGSYVCSLCERTKLVPKVHHSCHVCKKEVHGGRLIHQNCKQYTWLNGVVVGYGYNKFVEKLVAEFKYEGVTDLKSLLSKYLLHSVRELYLNIHKEIIITTVPSHSSKKLYRGYDHLELLAKIIREKSGIQYQRLLEKNKSTHSQVGFKKEDRLGNIRDTFSPSPLLTAHRPLPIVVLDDVMTTGTTLEECAKVLKKSGVEEVYGVVIARG